MQFTEVRQFMLSRLRNELPAHFTYHSVNHVLDVLHAAEEIGSLEGVSHHDMELLLTAVVFHDTGFLISQLDHEVHSCDIARKTLPGFGYSDEQIEAICAMIMVTRIPQKPSNLLEEIICDADLDYLGRDDFFEIGKGLFHELQLLGIVHNENEWNQMQVRFLEGHRYFTHTNIQRRNGQKEKHLLEVRRRLS